MKRDKLHKEESKKKIMENNKLRITILQVVYLTNTVHYEIWVTVTGTAKTYLYAFKQPILFLYGKIFGVSRLY